MLTENDIVSSVCTYLEERGWTIASRCDTGQRGTDIVAERDGQRLLVEAKGGTSSKDFTNRFGKPFSPSQVSDHVANAVFTALELRSREPDSLVAVALPDDKGHRRFVDVVEPSLERLGIGAFWVSGDRVVSVWGLNV